MYFNPRSVQHNQSARGMPHLTGARQPYLVSIEIGVDRVGWKKLIADEGDVRSGVEGFFLLMVWMRLADGSFF